VLERIGLTPGTNSSGTESPGWSFYLEKGQQACAAWQPFLQLQVEGADRFEQAQQFIQSWQSRLHQLGEAGDITAQFFCSFSFGDYAPPPFAAATVFLPRWQVSRQGNDYAVVANLLIQPDTELERVAQQLQREWYQLPLTNRLTALPPAVTSTCIPPCSGMEGHRFKAAVHQALDAIQAGKFEKLVLAQARDWFAPQPIDIFRTLGQLRLRYPECYVFCLTNGAGQTFLGASPERLLQLERGELVVDALAGSAPRGQTPIQDLEFAQRLLHSDKEQREHRVLVQDILAVLQGLGLNPAPKAPTGLLALPNIQHLQTLITAQVPPELPLLAILAKLHPTPAVAGFPRAVAYQQLPNYEAFERGLYAAPLGWMDTQGNGEFIVGLRSALMNGQQTRLYAGAGVVAGSDPEREFQEIQLKLQALLEVLF
jgi:menaquinone-specific isochorismate synthase